MRRRRRGDPWRVVRPEPLEVWCGVCGAWYSSASPLPGRPGEVLWSPRCHHPWERAVLIAEDGTVAVRRRRVS